MIRCSNAASTGSSRRLWNRKLPRVNASVAEALIRHPSFSLPNSKVKYPRPHARISISQSRKGFCCARTPWNRHCFSTPMPDDRRDQIVRDLGGAAAITGVQRRQHERPGAASRTARRTARARAGGS